MWSVANTSLPPFLRTLLIFLRLFWLINLLLWCFFLGQGSGKSMNIADNDSFGKLSIISITLSSYIFMLFTFCFSISLIIFITPLLKGSAPRNNLFGWFNACQIKCSPYPKPTSNSISLHLFRVKELILSLYLGNISSVSYTHLTLPTKRIV